MTERLHSVHGLEIEEKFGYWQAVERDGLIFCAGQVARDSNGDAVAIGDLLGQYEKCLENTAAILGPLGASLDDLIYVQTHVVPRLHGNWGEQIGEAQRRLLNSNPAGAVMAVTALNRDEFLVEVSSVAYIPPERSMTMPGTERLQLNRPHETSLGVSSAVKAGGLIFISGQLPLDAEGNVIQGGLAEQFDQCLENLRQVLDEAGATMDDVLYTHTFLTEGIDAESFEGICEAHSDAFAGINRPTGTMVYVPALALPKAHVAVTAIAAAR